MRGATSLRDSCSFHPANFNPRTPCGVRLKFPYGFIDPVYISIHAPHAGCDIFSKIPQNSSSNFNPRTPCGVRPACDEIFKVVRIISIHAPHAGCDISRRLSTNTGCNFNPRTPCGVRQKVWRHVVHLLKISIHAPHAGCDQPLPVFVLKCDISIHAPHAGCDSAVMGIFFDSSNFNPRTPCGVRRVSLRFQIVPQDISIHAPHAGCDPCSAHTPAARYISIHAPHAGCDFSGDISECGPRHFNPRTPCGVRLARMFGNAPLPPISIHAPHAGCDGMITVVTDVVREFQSTHPMRGATE